MTKEEFKNIYDNYFDTIRNHVYYRSGDTDLSTDITQETFIKVWEKQFDIGKGNVKSLLYKIAGDMFVSHVRHQKVIMENIPEIQFRFANTENNTSEEGLVKSKYEKALAKIPEKQRVVFLMNKIEGLSYKEIAEDLNLSVKAIEKRMSIALKTLKKEVLES